jgi:hypothetical protein
LKIAASENSGAVIEGAQTPRHIYSIQISNGLAELARSKALFRDPRESAEFL